MKLNILNKIYFLILIFLVILIIYTIFQRSHYYYYMLSVCRPKSYPIWIKRCHFIDDFNNEINSSIDFDYYDWGRDCLEFENIYPHRLPTKLILDYSSYSEQKTYIDTIKLPFLKIRKAFNEAKRRNRLKEIGYSYEGKRGLHFLIGIARNGNIKLWLRGIFLEELILQTKIVPKDPKKYYTYTGIKLTREEYFKEIFKEIPTNIKIKIDNGWEKESNYMDSLTNYINRNKSLWEYQKRKGYINYK